MSPVPMILSPSRRSIGQRSLRFVTLAVAFSTISGCTQLDPTHTGYLSDYSQLQSKDPRSSLFRPRIIEAGGAGPTALANIDNFTIAPIGWLAGEVTPGTFSEDCRKNLSAKLRQALVEELGTLRPVVETAGPRTARIRAAVTHVVFAKPVLNSALAVVAVPLFNGGGVVEAEVIAPDGQQIAVVVAALPGRATDVLGWFTWQGHAESAMRRSAVELKTILSPPTVKGSTIEPPLLPTP